MRRSVPRRRPPIRLALLASASILVLAATGAPVTLDPAGGPTVKVAQAGKCCFAAGTKVRMADGSERPIETLAPGDRVLGRAGANRVLRLVRTRLGRRRLWSINGSRPFVTAEHPFRSPDGWRAIEPDATRAENPRLTVAPLRRGDVLLRLLPPAAPPAGDGTARALDAALVETPEPVRVLLSVSAPADLPLFNLELDGDHSYVADGWIVHNKGGDGGGASGRGDDDDDDDDDGPASGGRGGSSDDDDRGGASGGRDDDRDDDDDHDDDHDDDRDDDHEDDDDDDDRSSDDDEGEDEDDSAGDDDRDDGDEDDVASDDDGAPGPADRRGVSAGRGGTGGETAARALSPAEERAALARGWR